MHAKKESTKYFFGKKVSLSTYLTIFDISYIYLILIHLTHSKIDQLHIVRTILIALTGFPHLTGFLNDFGSYITN